VRDRLPASAVRRRIASAPTGSAVFENRKQVEQPFELLLPCFVGQMLAAEIQILAHAHLAEQFARFRTLHEPLRAMRAGLVSRSLVTAADDFAAVGQEARNRINKSVLPAP